MNTDNGNPFANTPPAPTPGPAPQPPRDKYWLHILLFVLTLCTTTLAGAELTTPTSFFFGNLLGMARPMAWPDFLMGLPYALGFMLFLTTHEFGHYFTALYHRVRCSLPYFIPLHIPLLFNIGTLGAVIRIRQRPRSTIEYFDIGIAGPLAGFIVSVCLLCYGFSTLPPREYVYQIHPEYQQQYGHVPSYEEQLQHDGADSGAMAVGSSMLYWLLQKLLADPAHIPTAFEVMHYPFLFAGFITLFFTALNLLPIGQLDGGHVTYGLFGRKWAGRIARIVVVLMLAYAGIGLKAVTRDISGMVIVVLYYLLLAYSARQVLGTRRLWPVFALIAGVIAIVFGVQTFLPQVRGSLMWMLFVFMAVRVVRLDHPPAHYEAPLTFKRKVLGWVALAIFVLCFTPEPLYFPQAPDSTPTIFTHLPTMFR